ncbi:hypothetical protein PRZ48_009224 [Zasmidium cellare]|uniref:Uncharacterized protein n=1 Tax=Zasmidium cellare TaxID=395010 RepID=A0ABR0EB45_ZASCE|nr:hypothetical protein PRZ48_009224 [Zasmidium cellare]
MFCTSLRRRKSFASIVNSLTSPSSLGLRENDLRTHDVALSLSSRLDPATGNSRAARLLRVLLLSPSTTSDTKLPSTLERILRFAALTGGKGLAIVFLLSPADEMGTKASADGMAAYAKLQAEMLNHTEIPFIPILPLPKLEDLANLLKSHQTALSSPQVSNKKGQGVTPFDLLRQCSNQPPMSEAAAFMLTDLFSDLREVAEACTTSTTDLSSSSPSRIDRTTQTSADASMYELRDADLAGSKLMKDRSRGQSKLKSFRELQGDARCRDLIEFWNEEFPA